MLYTDGLTNSQNQNDIFMHSLTYFLWTSHASFGHLKSPKHTGEYRDKNGDLTVNFIHQ